MNTRRKHSAYRLAGLVAAGTASLLLLAGSAAAALTITFEQGWLIVESNDADEIRISCSDGNVKINDDPPIGAVACKDVEFLSVEGGPGANMIDLSAIEPTAFVKLVGAEVFGNDGDDVVIGSGVDDEIEGGFDSDDLSGGPGDDALTGDSDNDVVDGGPGDDFLTGATQDDTLYGGEGNDFLEGGAAPGVDFVHGEDGTDTLHFTGTNGNDTLTFTPPNGTLSAGTTTTFTGIENGHLNGSAGNDTLTTGDGSDYLDGGLGNDTLNAGSGGDGLLGGDPGVGGAAANTLNGGDGPDTIVFSGSDGNDDLNAGSPDGALTAGVVNDTYTSIQNFIINGLGGNDTITTGLGADTVDGGGGNDTLRTGSGNDLIDIFSGSDNVDGQAGSDEYSVLFGGLGTVTIADSGSAPPGDEDTLTVVGCSGVTVSDSQAVRGADVVNYSGIEKRPCGFTAQPPPAPQPAPPPPPPPPAVLPPPRVVRCVVPNVKGKTVAKAKAALKRRRCVAGKVKQAFSDKVKKGRVMAQSKRPGTRHRRGTKVNLTVSKGARKK